MQALCLLMYRYVFPHNPEMKNTANGSSHLPLRHGAGFDVYSESRSGHIFEYQVQLLSFSGEITTRFVRFAYLQPGYKSLEEW